MPKYGDKLKDPEITELAAYMPISERNSGAHAFFVSLAALPLMWRQPGGFVTGILIAQL